MRKHWRLKTRGWLVCALCGAVWLAAAAAQRDARQNPSGGREQETLKLDTALVTVPVIVSDRDDTYVPDLKQDEFALYEDGVRQEIAFFAPVKEPFNVVLMLDTSGSTREKIRQIQRAAFEFTEFIEYGDRMKVIAFDDDVHELCDFTNSRAVLRRAIEQSRPGKGTKLYDAFRAALNSLARLKGRKAVVLFSDGVDFRSDAETYDENIRLLEESGVIVYPIRYDTRAETEALVRGQMRSGDVAELSTILGAPRGPTTPTTVPGETRVPAGEAGDVSTRDPRLPPSQPPVVRQPLPGPGGRYPDRYPDDGAGRYPGRFPGDTPGAGRIPTDRFPEARYPSGGAGGGRGGDSRDAGGSPSPRGGQNDAVGAMLDNLYKTADSYLNDLAARSGGEVYRADTLASLPDAFARIAGELRHQYSLGYYPTNQSRRGKYRKIQVKVSRKEAVVRARPGYREPSGGG
jgi:hypothetical protein